MPTTLSVRTIMNFLNLCDSFGFSFMISKVLEFIHSLIPYWYLISRFWRGNISRGFIFAISIGKYEKRALNFAIEAFSTSFYFSKGLNCLKFLDNWNTTKHIFEN